MSDTTKSQKRTPEAKKQKESHSDADSTSSKRRLRLPPYRPFRFKHIKHPVVLPKAWQIYSRALRLLWSRRGFFIWLIVIYAILNIFFVQGLGSGVNTVALSQQLRNGFAGNISQLSGGLASTATAFMGGTSSTSTTPSSSGSYQLILAVMITLATIWSLRQISSGERIRVRDAFYKGMYPLVPFILVLLVIFVQLIPFLIGAGVYTVAISYGIAATLLEQAIWILLLAVATVITAYFLSSSLFALYIVTLPDMTPMKALRSARKMVQYRRLSVFRKLLFMILGLVIAATVIMLPFILFIPAIAGWLFFLLGAVALVVIHAYMYTLYRELLG